MCMCVCFEPESKTKRFDPCPGAQMSLPGAQIQETIVIVLGLQDPLPKAFGGLGWGWGASDINRISVSGCVWLWEGEKDKM